MYSWKTQKKYSNPFAILCCKCKVRKGGSVHGCSVYIGAGRSTGSIYKYLKNQWTKHSHVCTQIDAFFIQSPNNGTIVFTIPFFNSIFNNVFSFSFLTINYFCLQSPITGERFAEYSNYFDKYWSVDRNTDRSLSNRHIKKYAIN